MIVLSTSNFRRVTSLEILAKVKTKTSLEPEVSFQQIYSEPDATC